MLFFVGLGVEQSPSLESIEVMKSCDRLFFESYTTPAIKDASGVIEASTGKKVEKVKREFVEDGRKILELSKSSNIALVTFGDPMIATTHQELRTRAINQTIETRIVHASSILCALPGELGLHSYSFGKSVTMTREPMQSSAYLAVFQNLLRGLHTTILLEWDESSQFFLSPRFALQGLIDTEKDLKYGIVSDDSLVLSASGIGGVSTRVRADSLRDACEMDYGPPPHALVFPGRLHFTEIEALSALTGKEEKFFLDNSQNVERVAKRMVLKYAMKTLAALERARISAQAKDNRILESVFENVEAYTEDSKRFLNEGREELAILSIGYAEGLLDSLRFSGQIEFEW
ncbi:MAG TPA: diphthine synthase [Nitrososphaerales archaeon]|nr:diphthine synthase [Nitrososphaerales archaeon]